MTIKVEFGRLPAFENAPRITSTSLFTGDWQAAVPQLAIFAAENPTKMDRLNNILMGIEVECESVVPAHLHNTPAAWMHVRDGSLRNSGMEYVTRQGMRTGQAVDHMSKLFRLLNGDARLQVPPVSFSERCSVHVHVDCRALSTTNVVSLLMLYTLFEDNLFQLAGEGRKHNVFCVPINQAWASATKYTNFTMFCNAWERYSALNIKSLGKYGTLEFRQMEGTHDLGRLLNWIGLIAVFRANAIEHDHLNVLAMIQAAQTTGNYRSLAEKAFGPFAHMFKYDQEKLFVSASIAKYLSCVGDI